MKTFKMVVMAVIAFGLVGCAAHKEGDCITYSEGVCLLTYHNGVNTPSGALDMRYAGLVKSGVEISGSVKVVKAQQWDLK